VTYFIFRFVISSLFLRLFTIQASDPFILFIVHDVVFRASNDSNRFSNISNFSTIVGFFTIDRDRYSSALASRALFISQTLFIPTLIFSTYWFSRGAFTKTENYTIFYVYLFFFANQLRGFAIWFFDIRYLARVFTPIYTAIPLPFDSGRRDFPTFLERIRTEALTVYKKTFLFSFWLAFRFISSTSLLELI
jgi:hypothetical protein